MKKSVQSITTILPTGSRAYVFGSILKSRVARDIDVLVLYNPGRCSPQNAYQAIAPGINAIFAPFGGKVHLTLLTYRENSQTKFLHRVGGVPMQMFLRKSRHQNKVKSYME